MALTEEKVREALTAVVDPELGFNIVDLGLVYDVAIEGDTVTVTMRRTSMACPVGPQIVQEAREAVAKLEGDSHANINVVFSPPRHPDMMREEICWLFGRGWAGTKKVPARATSSRAGTGYRSQRSLFLPSVTDAERESRAQERHIIIFRAQGGLPQGPSDSQSRTGRRLRLVFTRQHPHQEPDGVDSDGVVRRALCEH